MRERAATGGRHSALQHTGRGQAAGLKEGLKVPNNRSEKGTVEALKRLAGPLTPRPA